MELNHLIQQLPKNELEKVLYILLENNELSKMEFMHTYGNEFHAKDWLDRFEAILKEYNFYVPWNEATSFYIDIENYLEKLKPAIYTHSKSCLKLLSLISTRLLEIPFTGEDEMALIDSTIRKYYHEFLATNPSVELTDLLYKIILDEHGDYQEDYIEFLYTHFNEERYFEDKLSYLLDLIDSASKYDLDEYLYYYIRLLYEHHEEVDYLFKQYVNYSRVREYEYELAANQNHLENTIAIVLRNLEYEPDSTKWYLVLIDLYHDSNQIDLEIKAIKTLLIQTSYKGNLDYYLRLKALFPQAKEFILSNTPIVYLKAIYLEEGMYECLLYACIESKYIEEEYKEILKEYYPDELLAFYTSEIVEELRYASNRSRYAHIVSQMKDLLEFEGGKIIIKGMIELIHLQYSRKPALLDELKAIYPYL